MKILYCGIYDRNYNRNRVFIQGLKKNNVEIIEVNGYGKKDMYLSVLKEAWKKQKEADVILVGYSGYYTFRLAIILKIFLRKKIVCDPLYSVYDTFLNDRKIIKENSIKAWQHLLTEWFFCRIMDGVILDTNEHIKYFVKTFKARGDKFYRVFVAADEELFIPFDKNSENDIFTVHYHGGVIPLQGVQYIIKAAKILENENILFRLVGVPANQDKNKDVKSAQELMPKNVEYIDEVAFDMVPKYVGGSDVCLGIFGGTQKAIRVIPNKVFEEIAMGMPVVSGQSMAMDEAFKDGENIIYCKMADAEDLAAKIVMLKNDKILRKKIGDNARQLFLSRLDSVAVGRDLISIFNQFVR